MTTPEKKKMNRGLFTPLLCPSRILNTPISSKGLNETLLKFNSKSG